MAKLIITSGLPRSGKTTWAKEMVAASGNYVRINRDDLRVMLHNNKWSPRNEEITIATQRAMVRAALAKGKSVIVDDTNLSTNHHESWKQIAKECDATFEVKKFESTNIAQLIARDDFDEVSRRGAHVIVRLALENGFISFPNDSVVVCDLDGTLCDIEHRRHFVRDGNKDWNSFFAGIPDDALRQDVHEMLVKFHKEEGKKIIFVSARPERTRFDTEAWLFMNGYSLSYRLDPEDDEMRFEALLMRPDSDTRNDTIIKKEILDRYLRKDWIHTVIDDRPSVVQMWRDNGLPVIDVGDGIDF